MGNPVAQHESMSTVTYHRSCRKHKDSMNLGFKHEKTQVMDVTCPSIVVT